MILAHVLIIIFLCAISNGNETHILRRLKGSNCVKISTGQVSPYDLCMGCVVEQAIECINDMRINISGNVPANCDLNGVTEIPQIQCCPKYKADKNGFKIALVPHTGAYPAALSCLRSVGCDKTDFYSDLLQECTQICAQLEPAPSDATPTSPAIGPTPSPTITTARKVKADLLYTCTAVRSPANRHPSISSLLILMLVLLSVLPLI